MSERDSDERSRRQPISRGLRPRPEDDIGAEMLRLIRTVVLMAVPELRSEHRGQVELVDVVETVPAPKRAVMRACRNGEIDSAGCIGRRWIAPRVAVDAWLRAKGPCVPVTVTERQEPRKKEQPDTGTRRAAIGGTAAGGQLAGGGFLSRRDLLRDVASA
jgi:hypothetical protein